MPTLNWIGKEAVIKHHKEVPSRLLEPDAALGHPGTDAPDGSGGGNLTLRPRGVRSAHSPSASGAWGKDE